MPARKSDNPTVLPARPPSPWAMALRSNWAIPLLAIALLPLTWLVEQSGFLDNYSRRLIMLAGINIILAVSLQLINGIAGQFSLGHAGFMAVGAYLAAFPSKYLAPDMDNPLAIVLFYLVIGLLLLAGAGFLTGLYLLIRWSRRLDRVLPLMLTGLVVVWLVADVSAATRWNEPPAYLVWTHLLRFVPRAYHLLLSAGLPAATAASGLIPTSLQPPLTFVALLIGGGLCASVAGLVVGIPALRLRGDYLAIATLGFAEIIRVLITNSQPLGGALGLNLIPRHTSVAWVYGLVIVSVMAIWRIAHSAKGRGLLAVREDEVAASAVGIDTTYHKVFAFVVGSFFAGVAGSLYAHFEGAISPDRFGFLRSVELVVMVTLAGSGSISGTIVAAVVLTYLPEELRQFKDWRMVIYAALLIGMMLLRPEGLLGGRELWWTRRRPGPAGVFPVVPRTKEPIS